MPVLNHQIWFMVQCIELISAGNQRVDYIGYRRELVQSRQGCWCMHALLIGVGYLQQTQNMMVQCLQELVHVLLIIGYSQHTNAQRVSVCGGRVWRQSNDLATMVCCY